MSREEGKKEASRELTERWSAQQKAEVVLRLLRGEDLGQLSGEETNQNPSSSHSYVLSEQGKNSDAPLQCNPLLTFA